MKSRFLLLFSLLCLAVSPCFSQGGNAAYRAYINQYSNMAVEQMNKYHIPASITLAQGILESGAGRSVLALKANNHFGIKCGSSWTGPYVLRDDDAPGEHFRKYSSVIESYEDHSRFLLKKRYEPLFQLDITDYRGWARTLKQCGYATSPTYAETLIKIIEDYSLFAFDRPTQTPVTTTVVATTTAPASQHFFDTHPVSFNNRNFFIRLHRGDDLKTVSHATGVKRRKLRKYNELPSDYVPQEGDILYLQKKRTHADRCYKGQYHSMLADESFHDVAQRYGIRLSSLYKMNHLPADASPVPGLLLRVY